MTSLQNWKNSGTFANKNSNPSSSSKHLFGHSTWLYMLPDLNMAPSTEGRGGNWSIPISIFTTLPNPYIFLRWRRTVIKLTQPILSQSSSFLYWKVRLITISNWRGGVRTIPTTREDTLCAAACRSGEGGRLAEPPPRVGRVAGWLHKLLLYQRSVQLQSFSSNF